MTQINTTVSHKIIGDDLTAVEFNQVVNAVDNNAQHAEPLLSAIENVSDNIDYIEQTNINSVQSYTIDQLPILDIEGTPAFSVEMGRPIYFKDGAWYRMHDDLPLSDLTEVDMFIVMGQSNADGKGNFTNLSSEIQGLDRSDILINASSLDAGGVYIPSTWEVINPGINTAAQLGKIGPELGLADTIKSIVDAGSDPDFNKPVSILKFAKGGSSLAVDWDSEHIDNVAYQGMITTFDDAPNQIIDNGYIFNIRGLIWYQGESDSQIQDRADAYQSNFVNFVDGVRNYLKIPDLPIVAVKVGVGPTKTSSFPYIDTVRQAIQNVADLDENIDVLDALNYTFRSDDVHLDADSLYQIGIDSVNKLRGMY